MKIAKYFGKNLYIYNSKTNRIVILNEPLGAFYIKVRESNFVESSLEKKYYEKFKEEGLV